MMRMAAAYLVLVLALTATLSGGLAADRDLRPTEPSVAALPPGSDVGGNSISTLALGAPDRDPAMKSGNPLWLVPLSALSATRDRPLFSASRRPPPSVAAVAAPAPQPVSAPPAPAAPEQPPLALVGTIVSPTTTKSIAFLKDATTQAVTPLRIGEENAGWRLQSVSIRSIAVEKGAQSVTIELPQPLIKIGEQAAPQVTEARPRNH